MGLKNDWVDIVDGKSHIVAEDINNIARAVIKNEEDIAAAYMSIESNNIRIDTVEEQVVANRDVIGENLNRIVTIESEMVELKNKNDFELIESVEFTEDVVTIIPNLNGNKYKELYMVFTIPTVNANGSNTDKGRIRCYANSSNTEFFTQNGTSIENYNTSWKMWLHFKFIGNYITGDLWHRKNANSFYLSAPSSSTHSGYTQPGFEMAEDYFDKLTIRMQDANYQQLLRCFPTGTKYDLWGVKK